MQNACLAKLKLEKEFEKAPRNRILQHNVAMARAEFNRLFALCSASTSIPTVAISTQAAPAPVVPAPEVPNYSELRPTPSAYIRGERVYYDSQSTGHDRRLTQQELHERYPNLF